MLEPPRYCHHCCRALQPNARKIARDGIAQFTKIKRNKMIGLFLLPAVMMTTTTQTTMTQTMTKMMTTTKTTMKATTTTAL